MGETIICIWTDLGVIVGLFEDEENDTITIKFPLKLVPQQAGGAGFTPFFLREEWIKIRRDAIPVQMEVGTQLQQAYTKARAEVFSNLVMP